MNCKKHKHQTPSGAANQAYALMKSGKVDYVRVYLCKRCGYYHCTIKFKN